MVMIGQDVLHIYGTLCKPRSYAYHYRFISPGFRADLTPITDISLATTITAYPEKYHIPLRLVNSFLHKEGQYAPMKSALENLRYLDHMLRGTSEYTNFADYMKRLFKGLYGLNNDRWDTEWADANKLGNADDDEQHYQSVMLNNLIIETACFYEVQLCLSEARRRFQEWKTLGTGFEPE